MPELDQPFLFEGDDDFIHILRSHQQALQERERYEAERKAAWDRGEPFPEDETKWYAFTNDCPRARERERANAALREWYWQHSEWKKHAVQKLRALKLGRKVGRRKPILRVYERAKLPEPIRCFWCKRMTDVEEREVDHLLPLTRGGDHTAANLRITCITCNQMKRDLLPEEFLVIIKPQRKANESLRRRGLQHQLALQFEPPRKGPRKATQLTLVKLREA
jgi:5-methylcytosine-specific restriction endonuclease McrA